jgi:hypothetical protein
VDTTDLDLPAEWARLQRCLIQLDVPVPLDTLEVWSERVKDGRAPFSAAGVLALQRWATAILEHDQGDVTDSPAGDRPGGISPGEA